MAGVCCAFAATSMELWGAGVCIPQVTLRVLGQAAQCPVWQGCSSRDAASPRMGIPSVLVFGEARAGGEGVGEAQGGSGAGHTPETCPGEPLLHQANSRVLFESCLQQRLFYLHVWFKRMVMFGLRHRSCREGPSFAVSWLTGMDRSCRKDIQEAECLGTELQSRVLRTASSAGGEKLPASVLGWLLSSFASVPVDVVSTEPRVDPASPQCSCFCSSLTASQALLV